MEDRIMTLPDRTKLLERLTKVDNGIHMRQYFYPLLLDQLADQEKEGAGIVMSVTMAIFEYTESQPMSTRITVELRKREFVRAIIGDEEPEVLADATKLLDQEGLL